MKKTLWIPLVVLVAGCNGSDGGSDTDYGDICGEPGDAGCGGDDGAAGDDANAGDDAGVGEHFTLVVPAGAQICSIGGGGDIFRHFTHQVRATCRAGEVILPRDKPTFEADWIEKLEVWPDGLVLSPKGPGTFTRTIQGTPDDGKYYYEFQQVWEAGGRDYDLVAGAQFWVEGGVVQEPVMTLDEATLTLGYKIGLFVVFPDSERGGASCACGFNLLVQSGVNIQTANGDVVYLRLKTVMDRCPPDMICAGGSGEGEVIFARFQRGLELREQGDFFQTAFTAVHHLGGQSYVVMFEQPVDTVHGIAVIRDPMGGEGTELSYLDANLNVIGTSEITFRELVQE